MSGNDSLADGFWTWQRKVNSPDRSEGLDADNWSWAVEAVEEVLASSTQESVDMIGELLAADRADPSVVGAGPLEDLLIAHGPDVVELVAVRARLDANWRLALASCWLPQPLRATLRPLDPYLSSDPNS